MLYVFHNFTTPFRLYPSTKKAKDFSSAYVNDLFIKFYKHSIQLTVKIFCWRNIFQLSL